MAPSAVIYGALGETLSSWERDFFRDADPWGFILFRRNVDAPDQLRRLVEQLREAVGRRAPVLIDQEGGRVARLRGPHWRDWGPPLALAQTDLPDHEISEALYLRYRWIGAELAELGIDVNCVPLLDVPAPGGHDIIGDRALGAAPDVVARRAVGVMQALAASGVMSVVKHLPGHGRADADSHLSLPTVNASRAELEAVDFAPFRALRKAPLGMSAHVVFTALDPDRPATQSPIVINEIIRGHIGFEGLLLTDDLSMNALSGDLGVRAAASLSAGCDIALHCNGDPEEMQLIAAAAPALSGESLERSRRVDDRRASLAPIKFDHKAAEAVLNDLAKRAGLDRV